MSDSDLERPADAPPFSLIDPARLDALARSGLMDSHTDEVFDRAARLATQITGRPVALLSLVDNSRQYFKALVGLEGDAAEDRGTALSHSFCKHVVERNEPLHVVDARLDPLVKDNEAIHDLGVIAYYGVPVHDAHGYVLGSFCAIDSQPHAWTNEEMAALHDLGAMIETELRLQQSLKDNKMLVSELNHRIKNIFTVTSSLVRMTARSTNSSEDMAEVLGERLRALDAAQSLAIAQSLRETSIEISVELTELFDKIMRPYNSEQVRIDGKPFSVTASAATAFALIFHELATNAMKYGALSDSAGRVVVTHRIQGDDLLLTWSETDVAADNIPKDAPQDGFGSRLIDMNLRFELSGTMSRRYRKDGLHIEMRVPLASVVLP